MKLFQRSVTFLFCIFVAFPILWLFYVAFLPPSAVMNAQLLPTGFSLSNFADLWGSGVFRAFTVSLLASGLTILGQLGIALFAAYAMRMGLKLFPVILIFLALPTELLLIPLYRELRFLHLIDTFWAIVIPFLASPLIIFLLFQSMKRLDWAMFEAASIDGANHWVMVTWIVAPLLRPELSAAGILGFAAHWNLVLFPKIMVSDRSLWTVQVFLNELIKNQPLDWGLLGAAAFVTTLPIILLYIVFEDRIIKVFESSFR